MQRSMEKDMYTHKINPNDTPKTRLGIWSVTSSLYDPKPTESAEELSFIRVSYLVNAQVGLHNSMTHTVKHAHALRNDLDILRQ